MRHRIDPCESPADSVNAGFSGMTAPLFSTDGDIPRPVPRSRAKVWLKFGPQDGEESSFEIYYMSWLSVEEIYYAGPTYIWDVSFRVLA